MHILILPSLTIYGMQTGKDKVKKMKIWANINIYAKYKEQCCQSVRVYMRTGREHLAINGFQSSGWCKLHLSIPPKSLGENV